MDVFTSNQLAMTTNQKWPIYQTVEKEIDSVTFWKKFNELTYEDHANIAFISKLLPKIQELEPVWIPVWEHEWDEEVLVTGIGGWRAIAVELDWCWFESTENPEEEIFPTHYMPLPQPPK